VRLIALHVADWGYLATAWIDDEPDTAFAEPTEVMQCGLLKEVADEAPRPEMN